MLILFSLKMDDSGHIRKKPEVITIMFGNVPFPALSLFMIISVLYICIRNV